MRGRFLRAAVETAHLVVGAADPPGFGAGEALRALSDIVVAGLPAAALVVDAALVAGAAPIGTGARGRATGACPATLVRAAADRVAGALARGGAALVADAGFTAHAA